jgi:acetolactate synthase-1/2/3 large subunit
MIGSELLVQAAISAGIEVCFANAGTTEMPIVTALDRIPGIRAVLGLFEGVCTGAADGYGRMAGKPAMTLLHLGPGFANGIANLHNARRAHTPVLNIVGDHATWHRGADAPLTMDIETLVGTVSGWQRSVGSIETIVRDIEEAIAAARKGQVASLIVPQDIQWSKGLDVSGGLTFSGFDPVDQESIESAARLMRATTPTALILGRQSLRRHGLEAAARIRAVLECDLLCETFPAYMERGAGFPLVQRIPYFPEQAIALLSKYRAVVLAGAREPVAFFGYKGKPSYFLTDDQPRVHIGTGGQDAGEALEHLADALGAPPAARGAKGIYADLDLPDLPQGDITPEKACAVLTAVQPENAVIVEEAVTTGFGYGFSPSTAAPHSYITITGGSIGQGIPCAAGAALACPGRRVINLQADGSAMYTLQGLWTQTRQGLDVTTLICNNKSYHILQVELERDGMTSLGSNTLALTSLDNPAIKWRNLSEGLGVPAVTAWDCETLAKELRRSLDRPGPFLIEMMLRT